MTRNLRAKRVALAFPVTLSRAAAVAEGVSREELIRDWVLEELARGNKSRPTER